jgi:tRNA (mo5U34)-methyltransferase
VDDLTDEQLGLVNDLLPWQCFTADRHGRRLGQAAWSGKRTDPQPLPDPRIQRLDELLGLRDRTVLEIGCFEGVHTTALCDLAADVTAVDARVENIAKTAVRCALLGVRPRLLVSDIEREPADSPLWRHDVVHHVGVLYHLVDPWSHLSAVAGAVRHGLMLDTHYALDDEADEDWAVAGRTLKVRRYAEGGASEVFSGMYPFARWLRHDDLVACLTEAGLSVVVDDCRQERNGARVLLIAERR